MAPEVLFNNKYGYASDVFAFGVTFYELLHLVTPWESETEEELRAKLATNTEVKFKEGLSSRTIALIRKCLVRDPLTRITIEELVQELAA